MFASFDGLLIRDIAVGTFIGLAAFGAVSVALWLHYRRDIIRSIQRIARGEDTKLPPPPR